MICRVDRRRHDRIGTKAIARFDAPQNVEDVARDYRLVHVESYSDSLLERTVHHFRISSGDVPVAGLPSRNPLPLHGIWARPPPPWRRKSRLKNRFSGEKSGPKKLKKFTPPFERPASLRDQLRWERLSLPNEAMYGASAHPPQRLYSLTRPVVPPGGSFRFWGSQIVKRERYALHPPLEGEGRHE